MKIFNLLTYQYDGGWDRYFIHPDDTKTFNDFKKDCNDMIVKYSDEYLNSLTEDYQQPYIEDWIEFIAKKLAELGYSKCDMSDVTYGFSGNGYMFNTNDDDWKNERSQKEFVDIIGEVVYSKACKIYDKAQEILNKEMEDNNEN
jgi:hypothetical protein